MVVPPSQDVIPQWFRGGASWSGRNSMALVNGSSWWCLMVST